MDGAIDSRDDHALLRAVAIKRDRAACDELYKRYQARAYNLAIRILHNSALAQEAVQEVMLSIWRTSESTLPTGNAKDWIMRVVMNKSISIANARRQAGKREDRVRRDQTRQPETVESEFENAELIFSLRENIDQLPEFERTVIAYRYCAGASQEEIAKLVGVSQRTVSTRIQQALTRLRTGLLSQGFADSTALVFSSELLFEAMTTGRPCPEGIWDSHSTRKTSRRGSTRSVRRAIREASRFSPAIVIAVLVVAAVTAWVALNQRASPVATPMPAPKAVEPAAPSAQPRVEPFYKRWDFQKGPPEDLKPQYGKWNWIADASDGKGAMFTGTSVISLPDSNHVPMMITVSGHVKNGGETNRIGASICWFVGTNIGKHHWIEVNCGHVGDSSAYAQKSVCVGNYIINYMNGKCVGAKRFQRAFTDGHIDLSLNNLAISSIEMRALGEQEMTDDFRDPERIIALLRKDPSLLEGGD